MARKGKGRQKIEMTKIRNESNLLVTFSKRRSGFFKKASELCILCGVEIAIIVFSPGKKVFSFGHPNMEQMIDKFLIRHNSNPTTDSGIPQPMEAHLACTHELNMQLTGLHNQLEAQKNYGEELTNLRKQRQALDWWEAPIEYLGLEQLQMLKSGLKELKEKVANQTKNLALMQQVQDFASSSSGGGNAADGAGPAIGFLMTPQGYTLG